MTTNLRQSRTRPGWAWASAALVAGAGALAYRHSLAGPFLLDDAWNTVRNPSIRHLWPLGPVLHPPADLGVAGRPIYNLSFALNYALGGAAPRGYHAGNVLIHLFAGLTLLGIGRRTLGPAFGLALALLWTLHPIQTEAVTYISERSESLMGLAYLLTLYGFIRYTAAESGRGGGWAALAIAASWLGMATKEVMATAPLLVLLYDRTFVAGSFRAAGRSRAPFYLALAAGWIWIAHSLVGANRHGVGFGLGPTAWTYALTEARVVLRYLGLTVWPHPLVFDYGPGLAAADPATLACGAGVLGLAALALISLRFWPAAGFAACWFFLILAPTSSFVPIASQPMAESRLYLPLAGVLALGVAGLRALGERVGLSIALILALAYGGLAAQRNATYRSDLAIWEDTTAKRPANPRAHANLGAAYFRHGRKAEALTELAAAVSLAPSDAPNRILLANVLADAGRTEEAEAQYKEAERLVSR